MATQSAKESCFSDTVECMGCDASTRHSVHYKKPVRTEQEGKKCTKKAINGNVNYTERRIHYAEKRVRIEIPYKRLTPGAGSKAAPQLPYQVHAGNTTVAEPNSSYHSTILELVQWLSSGHC